MRQAYRLAVFLLAVTMTLALARQSANAQNGLQNFSDPGRGISFGSIPSRDFGRSFTARRPNSRPSSRIHTAGREDQIEAEIEAELYDAIQDRLGAPYRYNGTDDRGYDCSGLVWSVFQDIGVDLVRASARSLWQTLPEADEEEEKQFGTLVFFSGLNHVGIVRDAYSFYHASTSQGVVRSFYSGYWEDKVVGYRRVPLPGNFELIRR